MKKTTIKDLEERVNGQKHMITGLDGKINDLDDRTYRQLTKLDTEMPSSSVVGVMSLVLAIIIGIKVFFFAPEVPIRNSEVITIGDIKVDDSGYYSRDLQSVIRNLENNIENLGEEIKFLDNKAGYIKACEKYAKVNKYAKDYVHIYKDSYYSSKPIYCKFTIPEEYQKDSDYAYKNIRIENVESFLSTIKDLKQDCKEQCNESKD